MRYDRISHVYLSLSFIYYFSDTRTKIKERNDNMMTKKKMILAQKKQLIYTQVALGATAALATGATVASIVNANSCKKLRKEMTDMKQEMSIEMSGQMSEVSRLCEQNTHDINVMARAINMTLK